MELPSELPNYLRYDIFLSIFGILIFYFAFTNMGISRNVRFQQVLIIVSLFMLGVGIFKMKQTYDMNWNVWELEYRLRLKHLKKRLKEK